jgi:SAM-dependent methyltransferase
MLRPGSRPSSGNYRRPAIRKMPFKDHFSRQSAAYGRYRPVYPPELIEYVARQAPGNGTAVDCATGSGQAAVALGRHFERVLAIDGSYEQLASAVFSHRVRYAVALAEQLPLPDHSVVLVTAAQAAHWFDHDRFHSECRRVLVPGGVLALWCYGRFSVDTAVDAVVDRFYFESLGRFWPPERDHIDAGYRSLPFPFSEAAAPRFSMGAYWTLGDLLGYLSTWSALRRYKDALGQDPLPALRAELMTVWPERSRLRICWPLYLRLGRL